jgi:hypothetical protein
MVRRRVALALAVALVMLPASALAQETATERDAGRGVLEKMDVLERSLDVPNIVSRLTGPNDARDRVVARAKELMDTELLAVADDIATHPEIGFEEKRTVQKLTEYLKQYDFDVQIGVAGLPTAFVAKYKRSSGAPTLGVILEYDALRGSRCPFHGDQHSAQGPVGMAAAIAVAEGLSLARTPGNVVVYGTPGEEIMPPNAKTVMHQAHVFDGAPASSGAAWNGRNALEAVIHFFENIDSVRSSIRPEARIQGVIVEGGTTPNLVPDRTVADFSIRYPDEVYLQQVVEFVDRNEGEDRPRRQGTRWRQHLDTQRTGVRLHYSKKFGATNVQPAAKANGVWPCNDAWLRAAL